MKTRTRQIAVLIAFLLVFPLLGCQEKPELRADITYIDPAEAELFTTDDPTEGDESAPITLVAFTDFECPHCAELHQNLESIREEWIDTGKVKVQYRDFPIARHANSLSAHVGAAAAHRQGKFLDYQARLYQDQEKWAQELDPAGYFLSLAQDLGLDEEQFREDYNDKAILKELEQDRDEGRALGVSATPSLFINGELFIGVMPTDRLQRELLKVDES